MSLPEEHVVAVLESYRKRYRRSKIQKRNICRYRESRVRINVRKSVRLCIAYAGSVTPRE